MAPVAPAPDPVVLAVGVEEQAASRARPARAPNALNFIVKPSLSIENAEIDTITDSQPQWRQALIWPLQRANVKGQASQPSILCVRAMISARFARYLILLNFCNTPDTESRHRGGPLDFLRPALSPGQRSSEWDE
jgi:hypothetical protein